MTADPKAPIDRPDPWRIYVLFSETGTIRKWDFMPFEIDGVRATEFHSVSVHGLHTCSDVCDRPLCVAQREIASAEAEIARLRGIVMRQTIALQAIADPEPHEPADGMVCAIIARKALNQETDQ